MPPRPARFSKSTKAAKPAVAIVEDGVPSSSTQEQQHQHNEVAHKRSRTCSVEVIITPTKKRRTNDPATGHDHVQHAPDVMVTPTKTQKTAASSFTFLPTPPITPTISISEHDNVDDEDDRDSICLRTPSTASSSSSSSAFRRIEASPSPSPTPSNNANIYARARSLLRLSAHGESTSSSSTSQLVGRQAERAQLDAFLKCHFPTLYDGHFTKEENASEEMVSKPKKAKALYISGSPGTGKTALLHNILQELSKREGSMIMSLLNCTTVQRPEDIWTRLAEELDLALPSSTGGSRKGKGKARWTAESFREALSGSTEAKSLVVLDEIDHLLPDSTSSSSTTTNNINVLSTLFSIALDPSSNLVLVGIANALDLTQRYSSLLFGSSSTEGDESKEEGTRETITEPELLHFRPFQSDEMVAIVKQRLSTLHDFTPTTSTSSSTAHEDEGAASATKPAPLPLPLPIIMPAALELAAKKVSAVTGDLRSFLSLIRKAVEIFETEQRKRLLDLQASTSSSSSRNSANGPVSPTKNMLAYRSRKRKLSMSAEGDDEDDEEKEMQDPLSKFDAKTAPKLTPAHILKATRVVSLVSSSSANSRSSTTSIGINSSAGSLSTSSSSSNNLLQSKIAELNLHQRLALTSFLILLARRIAAKVPTWSMVANSTSSSTSTSTPTLTAQDQSVDIDAEASSIPSGGARPSELYSLYRTLLEKEDLIHPVSNSEFSDLLSGLHTRGLVGLEREISRFTSSGSTASGTTLAPPMMRRSSSSSSVSSAASGAGSGRNSRSPSPNSKNNNTSGAHAPLYLLYPFTSLQSVLSPPSITMASTKASTTEASTICSNLLTRESKRLVRIQKQNQQLEIQRKENELAPRAGFNGDGLDHNESRTIRQRVSYVGEKDKRGREGEIEEEGEAMEVDHEEKEKIQQEEDEKKEKDDTPNDW